MYMCINNRLYVSVYGVDNCLIVTLHLILKYNKQKVVETCASMCRNLYILCVKLIYSLSHSLSLQIFVCSFSYFKRTKIRAQNRVRIRNEYVCVCLCMGVLYECRKTHYNPCCISLWCGVLLQTLFNFAFCFQSAISAF